MATVRLNADGEPAAAAIAPHRRRHNRPTRRRPCFVGILLNKIVVLAQELARHRHRPAAGWAISNPRQNNRPIRPLVRIAGFADARYTAVHMRKGRLDSCKETFNKHRCVRRIRVGRPLVAFRRVGKALEAALAGAPCKGMRGLGKAAGARRRRGRLTQPVPETGSSRFKCLHMC